MIRNPRYDHDEARGRFLYAQLLQEGEALVAGGSWDPGLDVPAIPSVPIMVTTDTGTMRAIVVAS